MANKIAKWFKGRSDSVKEYFVEKTMDRYLRAMRNAFANGILTKDEIHDIEKGDVQKNIREALRYLPFEIVSHTTHEIGNANAYVDNCTMSGEDVDKTEIENRRAAAFTPSYKKIISGDFRKEITDKAGAVDVTKLKKEKADLEKRVKYYRGSGSGFFSKKNLKRMTLTAALTAAMGTAYLCKAGYLRSNGSDGMFNKAVAKYCGECGDSKPTISKVYLDDKVLSLPVNINPCGQYLVESAPGMVYIKAIPQAQPIKAPVVAEPTKVPAVEGPKQTYYKCSKGKIVSKTSVVGKQGPGWFEYQPDCPTPVPTSTPVQAPVKPGFGRAPQEKL
ncbi:hypothetical protein JXB27_00670 [Candidatus Woesearchaeota archaeon]|nr:hypothetical protein [Candidatus Woesearchaeota archaeon]